MIARYKILLGNKQINDFLRRADLFESKEGVGAEKEISITWKEGEEVTPLRARSAMQNLQDSYNKSDETEDEILSWELLTIETYSSKA